MRLADRARRRIVSGEAALVGMVEYGIHSRDEQPLTEDAEQRPLTVYAASKRRRRQSRSRSSVRGARIVCTRSFNHSGAGQANEYLLPSLVGRARALKRDGGRRSRSGTMSSVTIFTSRTSPSAYLASPSEAVPARCTTCGAGAVSGATVGR